MQYTDTDNQNWSILYGRAMQALPEIADEKVMKGIKTIGLPSNHIPSFDEINKTLASISDWQLVLLNEMVEDTPFISLLAEKKYPCRTWLRSREQVDSDENEYDLFHDLIGHTTLLYMPEYCNYLEGGLYLYLERQGQVVYLEYDFRRESRQPHPLSPWECFPI